MSHIFRRRPVVDSLIRKLLNRPNLINSHGLWTRSNISTSSTAFICANNLSLRFLRRWRRLALRKYWAETNLIGRLQRSYLSNIARGVHVTPRLRKLWTTTVARCYFRKLFLIGLGIWLWLEWLLPSIRHLNHRTYSSTPLIILSLLIYS